MPDSGTPSVVAIERAVVELTVLVLANLLAIFIIDVAEKNPAKTLR